VTALVKRTTAETHGVKAAGIEFAYRRFGRAAEIPLVLRHFRGNLDNWDPALIDALAAGREVVLVDYPGVGSSTWCADQHHSRDGAPDDRILSARSASSGSTCSGSRSVGSSRRKSC